MSVFLVCWLFFQVPSTSPVYVIDGVNVVQPDLGTVLTERRIVIADGRIADVGSDKDVKIPNGAVRIDGADKYVVSGYWDMHVHLTNATELALPMLVVHGVTGVRDMGGDWETVRGLRDRVRGGEILGPVILAPGPFFDGSKPGVPHRQTVLTAEEAVAAAREVAALGVDFFKVHNGISRDAYFALMAEAKRLGKRVDGHVPMTVEPLEAAKAGQGSFEHVVTCMEGTYSANIRSIDDQVQRIADFVDEHGLVLFRQLKQYNVVMNPTLVAYDARHRAIALKDNPDARRRYLAASIPAGWDRDMPLTEVDFNPKIVQLRADAFDAFVAITGRMREAGLTIVTGSDLGAREVYPGSSLLDEFDYLAKAGFTAPEILVAAVWNPVVFLGLDKQYGKVAKGYVADLVLLGANPLDDIANARQIEGVFRAGRYLNKDDRRALMDDVHARRQDY